MKLFRIEFNGEVNRRYAYVMAESYEHAEDRFRAEVPHAGHIFSNVWMRRDMVIP